MCAHAQHGVVVALVIQWFACTALCDEADLNQSMTWAELQMKGCSQAT